MAVAYLIFLALGVAAYLMLARFTQPMRVGIALAVFLIPSLALTAWVVWVGDRPSPDAVIVVPGSSEVMEDSDSGE